MYKIKYVRNIKKYQIVEYYPTLKDKEKSLDDVPINFDENGEFIESDILDKMSFDIFDEENEELRHRNYLKESMHRAKRTIIDYCLNNDFNFFFTLTFSDKSINRYDYKLCSKKIREHFKYYKKLDDNFKYVLVAELHEKKEHETIPAIHFHGMATRSFKDLKYLSMYKHKYLDINSPMYKDEKMLKKFGRNNWVSITETPQFMAYYITKYITKQEEKILPKFFYNSKGLLKSQEISEHDRLNMVGLQPKFENLYCKIYEIDESEIGALIKYNRNEMIELQKEMISFADNEKFKITTDDLGLF